MAENAFVNTNRYPKNNYQNNEDIVNYKRTTITDDPPAHNSTNPLSESATGEREKSRAEKKNNPASSSATKKQSVNPVRKLFQSCARCCRRKKARIAKSKTSFVESVKEKAKKCRSKKKRSKQPAAAKVEHPVTEDKQEKKTEVSKKAKKKKRKKEHKKGEPLDATVPSLTTVEPDQDGKSSLGQILGADGQDFTKSCCYLCAKNAMAIAAAISGQKDKTHVSIQTSVHVKEKSTTDKSCSPMMYVRTVQSSVKVRTRDMGTLHPEKKKKSKRAKPKLNFKRFSLIPKVKFAGRPRVRTVACETDKSMGHNNTPLCRARHGTHCVTENK